MKKNICVLASLIMFVQVEAGCGGLSIIISPLVKRVFVQAAALGLQSAENRLSRFAPYNLRTKLSGSLVQLIYAIRRSESCDILYNNDEVKKLSADVVSSLNSNSGIIASYNNVKCPTLKNQQRRWIEYVQYLHAVDVGLAGMQRERIPRLNNSVLNEQNPCLRYQIEELILNNKAVLFSEAEMNDFNATMFGKLAAMQAILTTDLEAFVVLYGDCIEGVKVLVD